MSGSTDNLGLVTPELADKVKDTIPSLANNFSTIDKNIGSPSKLPTGIPDLMTGIANHDAQLASIAIDVLHPPIGLVAAKGDGVTDDTSAINGCINYAKNNGIGRIYIPDTSSYYIISGTLTVADDTSYGLRGVKITGNSKGKTKLKKTTSGYMFNLNGTQEVELSNMWLEGNGSTGTTDGILLTSGTITSQHNVIEKIHFNNIRNAIDLGDGTVANHSQEVDHVKMETLTLTNVFNGIRIRSYNNQLTTINQVRIFLASGSTGSGIELGQVTSGGTTWGTSSIKISNTDCSLIDRNLTGSSSFLKVSGTANQIEIDSCWCEAIDNSLYVSSGVGIQGRISNTTFNASMVFNYSSALSFNNCSLRNIVLNSGVFKGQFTNTQLQTGYSISGAATINALIDWWDSGMPRKTFSGTYSVPRHNTGSLGVYTKAIGGFASGSALIAGVNSITFTCAPTLNTNLINPIVLVTLLDPANIGDSVYKLWGSIALNTPSNGTHAITINLRLSTALTLTSDFKFYFEVMDSVF